MPIAKVGARKGKGAGDQLKRHDSERIHVRCACCAVTSPLLWRRVCRRHGMLAGVRGGRGVGVSRNPEVAQALPAVVEEHVLRLKVSMYDVAFEARERVGDVREHGKRLAQRKRSA